ncbi:hypothetical protein SteCoe_13503 [Stentor coeruleus]|uniref:VHS domain-containing protein n=1 Tax=Stentor coeruleus TaxID=5963 RepID=A0A1R2C8I0_9CILI|nr:hypothetical protein SteCoe_13503 [Stentor coeruleus]
MTTEEEKILKDIISNENSDNSIAILVSKFPKLERSSRKSLLQTLFSDLFSNDSSYLMKYQSIRILKHVMGLKISKTIKFIDENLMPKITSLIFSKDDEIEGFSLWLKFRKNKDKNAFKLMVIILQCIENWGKNFTYNSKGANTNFSKILNEIKRSNIEIPPIFFMKAFEKAENGVVKRDLKRVQRFIDAFEKLIIQGNKEEALLFKKIANSYETFLKESIEKYDDEFESIIMKTFFNLRKTKNLLLAWKNLKYAEVSYNELKQYGKICNPLPKEEPYNENYREMINQIDVSFDLDVSEILHFENSYPERKFESSNQINQLKKQAEELENLVNAYKQDISKTQTLNFLLERENNELGMKNKALLVYKEDLERNIKDQKFLLECISTENTEAKKLNAKTRKRFEKAENSNEFFKKSIEELRDLANTLSEETSQNKIYADSVKNTNKLLLNTNANLRTEIEEIKSNQKDLKRKIRSLNKSVNY